MNGQKNGHDGGTAEVNEHATLQNVFRHGIFYISLGKEGPRHRGRAAYVLHDHALS